MRIENAANLRYADIVIGAVYEFDRTLMENDVFTFAKLSGDYNPLHVDRAFGKKSQFGKNVVHGMLAAALFSRLVGMYCPGEKSLYMSQTLQFKLPLFHGDTVTVRGTVIGKNDSIKLITLKTEIIKGSIVVIAGEAKIKVQE